MTTPAAPRTSTATAGELEAEVDTDNTHGGPQHRAEQRQTGAVADDLHGERFAGGAGDGQVRQDDLGQAGQLADVGVDDLGTDPSGSSGPAGEDNGAGDVFAAESGECGSEGERGREQAPEHRAEPDTDPNTGDDDEHHLIGPSVGCVVLERGLAVEQARHRYRARQTVHGRESRREQRRHHQQGDLAGRGTEGPEVAVADHEDAER